MVNCIQCGVPLSTDSLNHSEYAACPSCKLTFQIMVFQAFFQESAAVIPTQVSPLNNEASCFYHPGKKAEHVCDGCGRFLCALCDVKLSGQHLCPSCIQIRRQKGKMEDLDTHRVRYDKLSFVFALFPIMLFFITIITAPIALFIALRFWNAPLSIISKTRHFYIAAIVLSLLQIAGWCIFFYKIVTVYFGLT